MILHLIPPAFELKPFIKTYWYLKKVSSEVKYQTIVPNGHTGLCFYRNGALKYQGLGEYRSGLGGQRLNSLLIESSIVEAVGVEFEAYGLRRFFFNACHGFLWSCLFFLDKAFAYYGIDEIMSGYAEIWAPIPFLVTVFLVLCFGLAGLYALSANGDIKKLIFTRIAVFIICILFIGRALWGFAMMLGKNFSMLSLVTNFIALSVGICYLPGLKNHN